MSNLVPEPTQPANIKAPSVPNIKNVPAQPTVPTVPNVPTGTISILGYSFSKTHVYIAVGIAVIVLGYFIYKWYVNDTEEAEPTEEFNEEDFNEPQFFPEENIQQEQYQPVPEQDPLQELN